MKDGESKREGRWKNREGGWIEGWMNGWKNG